MAANFLLPRDQYKMVDNAIGVVVIALFVAGGAWVLFWVVRLRRWRRQQALKDAQKLEIGAGLS